MSYSLPPLQWLRAYEAAARLSSFSAAAAELNLTPAAISHQVRALEQHLGFQLFKRLARGLQLTDIGQAYLPSIRQTFDELTVSTVGLFGRDRVTHISVRASLLFATTWITPFLPEFAAGYPHIKLRLLAAIWADASASVDVDIRFGDGQWSDFDVRPLWREPSVLVIQKGADVPAGSTRDMLLALMENGVVQIMGCEDRWIKIIRRYEIADRKVRVNTMTDNSFFAMEMTAAGLGPCIVQRSYAEAFVRRQPLLTFLPEGIEIEDAHYILTPRSAERINPEAIIFRDWLMARMQAVGTLAEPGASAANNPERLSQAAT